MDNKPEYKIRLLVDKSEYTKWCIEHFGYGTWYKKVSFTGTSATYIFLNAEDLTAFVIGHNLEYAV